MMQAGTFVAAETFESSLCPAFFSYFKREDGRIRKPNPASSMQSLLTWSRSLPRFVRSRLCRSMKPLVLLASVRSKLPRARKSTFDSLRESIDTATPAGKMVFTVLLAVAQLARRLIVESVIAGLPNARGSHSPD